MDRRLQAFGGRWSHLQAIGGIRGSSFTSVCFQLVSFTSHWWQSWTAVLCLRLQMESFTSRSWHTWIVVYMPLVAYVDRRLQALGGLRGSSCTRLLVAYVDRRVESFGGIHGLSIASLWWLTWIAVLKPLVADGVVYKPLVAYVDRRSQELGGIWSHLQAFSVIFRSLLTSIWRQKEYLTSLWWLAWITVHKTKVADGVIYKALVAYVVLCNASGGVHESSCRSLGWHTWIVDCKLLVAYVDCRLQAFGGLHGSSVTSLWWQMESLTSFWWHPLIIVYRPLVGYMDRSSHTFGGRWSHLQAFRGIRGSSFTSLWWLFLGCTSLDWQTEAFTSLWWLRGSPFTSLRWQMESFTSLSWHTWIVVYMPFVA